MPKPRLGLPHEPPIYEDADVAAIRALASGSANEGQQKRAWDWIVYQASAVTDLSYYPNDMGGDRATSFKEGRRFVGAQLLKLLQPALTPKQKEEK